MPRRYLRKDGVVQFLAAAHEVANGARGDFVDRAVTEAGQTAVGVNSELRLSASPASRTCDSQKYCTAGLTAGSTSGKSVMQNST